MIRTARYGAAAFFGFGLVYMTFGDHRFGYPMAILAAIWLAIELLGKWQRMEDLNRAQHDADVAAVGAAFGEDMQALASEVHASRWEARR